MYRKNKKFIETAYCHLQHRRNYLKLIIHKQYNLLFVIFYCLTSAASHKFCLQEWQFEIDDSL